MAEKYGITSDAVLGEMRRITAEEDDAGEKCPCYSLACPSKMVMLDVPYQIRKKREEKQGE